MKPIIALVGRPNVGKSTLFNRLTGGRDALVADVPGLTRDRLYGDGRIGDRPYVVIDTGGIVEGVTPRQRRATAGGVSAQIGAHIRQAVAEADAILFLADGRGGLNAADQEIANDLRRLGARIWLVVNKCEGLDAETAVADFYSLGLGQPFAVSAAHGRGVAELMDTVLAGLPQAEEELAGDESPRIAVVGRPNVGKSTLINALLGEERVIVCDAPGTTRDSVLIPMKRRDNSYILIDTAGIRRRSRIDDRIEKYSVIKSLQAIESANVCILVVDASQGMSEQDAALAGYILEAGRSLVLAVNKWDALDAPARAWIKRELDRKLPFLTFARPYFISALRGTGVAALFGAVDRAFESAHKTLSTGRLNRILQQAMASNPPPVVRGRRIKLKYAHQGGKNPPRVVIHGSQARSVPPAYRRFLANRLREEFRLEGTAVRLEFKEGKNPFSPDPSAPRRRVKSGRRLRR